MSIGIHDTQYPDGLLVVSLDGYYNHRKFFTICEAGEIKQKSVEVIRKNRTSDDSNTTISWHVPGLYQDTLYFINTWEGCGYKFNLHRLPSHANGLWVRMELDQHFDTFVNWSLGTASAARYPEDIVAGVIPLSELKKHIFQLRAWD